MKNTAILLSLALLTSQVAYVPLASASIYPDVPSGHIFQEPIEQLSVTNVISGNPDGYYYPDRFVNRAEMLKLLYKASGKAPDPSSVNCFNDVEQGSWYEPYVCDAAAKRFVNGYSNDNTFRPGNAVNRVEALKMILTVFEMPIDEVDEIGKGVVNFVDVSTTAWYTKYLYNSYSKGILPIAEQDTSRFYPDAALKRGEAAAMIYNALYADLQIDRSGSSSSSSENEDEDMEDEDQEAEDEDETMEQEDKSESSVQQPSIISVSIPFDTSGKFVGKKSSSYKFTNSSQQTVHLIGELQSGQPGELTCTLYLLEEDGFSHEYYRGISSGKKCQMITTLKPGEYQLQLQPSSADTTYNVEAMATTGDGNDGFIEARRIDPGTARTFTLVPNNFEDYYTFTVDSAKSTTVEVSNSQNLRCHIYPLGDVDLPSFETPKCNSVFSYPTGTYYVAVGRDAPTSASLTYTVKLSK